MLAICFNGQKCRTNQKCICLPTVIEQEESKPLGEQDAGKSTGEASTEKQEAATST